MIVHKFKKYFAQIITLFIPVKIIRRIARTYISGEKDYLTAIGHDLKTHILQDELIKYENLKTKALIIMMVPKGNFMSGGIYAMFTIANYTKEMKNIHNAEVIIMTILNKNGHTYFRQTNFKNNNFVFRFEQILEYKNLEKLIIHIPEESAAEFYSLLTDELKNHLKKINSIQINIMNQNIKLMPNTKYIKDLFNITDNITQTVAHHRYCTQEITNKYKIPAKLIVPYTDISNYSLTPFEQKTNRILYTRDNCQNKIQILDKLYKELGKDCILKEINNLSFDEYLELTQDSKFMITFGEGYDGYFAQSMLLGGICFAVYNNDFFPKEYNFKKPNIFFSYEDMYENIVQKIKYFEKMDESERIKYIDYFNKIQHNVSQKDSFIKSLQKFYKGEMDFYPQNSN